MIAEFLRPVIYLVSYARDVVKIRQDVAIYMQVGCPHGKTRRNGNGLYLCPTCTPSLYQPRDADTISVMSDDNYLMRGPHLFVSSLN